MHLRVWGRGPIGRNTNLYHAKGEIHLSLNIPREDTCEKIDNYVKWVLLRDPWWWQNSILGFPLSRASYKSTSSQPPPWRWQSSILGFPLARASYKSTSSRPPPWWWQSSILGSPWAWASYKSTSSRPLPFWRSGLITSDSVLSKTAIFPKQ